MKTHIHYRRLIDMMDELEDFEVLDPDEWEIDYGDYDITRPAHAPRRWSPIWVGSMLLLNFILWCALAAIIPFLWR
jgi:hypothetical protein